MVREKQWSLAMAKSRFAPTKKKLTLPELERMAALTAARLASHLQEQLQVMRVTLWSDSQIVLHWLKGTKLLKPFLNTCIQEVKKLTSISNWRYCPTTENPSDLLKRGITAHQLKTSSLWKHGPTWLPNRSQWPSWPTTGVSPLISHWKVYWWAYCKWYSSKSITRPSSPDQCIWFQPCAKAFTHYSICFQICTAPLEESSPTRSNYSYGIRSCHDRMGEESSICCLSCWSWQPLLKVTAPYNFGTSTSPFP